MCFYNLLTDCDVGALRWVQAVNKILINYSVIESEGSPGILLQCLLDVQRICPSCAYHSSWGIPCIVQEQGRKNRWVSQRNGSDQSGRQKAFHLEVCGHAEVPVAALKAKGSMALMEDSQTWLVWAPLFWKEKHVVQAVCSSLLSNGEEDMFGNSVEQEIPTLFSGKKVKKVFGWGGVWGAGGLLSFFPKGSKSFAAATRAVTSQSLGVVVVWYPESESWIYFFFPSLVQRPPYVVSRILFHLSLPYQVGA